MTASGSTSLCPGGSVTLTAPAGFTYLWSNGAIGQSITVSAAGSYSVTVTNANGCPATSAPVGVTVNPLPQTPTITASGPTSFCQGGSVTLTALHDKTGKVKGYLKVTRDLTGRKKADDEYSNFVETSRNAAKALERPLRDASTMIRRADPRAWNITSMPPVPASKTRTSARGC